ncbi:hypothetical protein KY290_028771 [Solanum tuberosum]|uniref:Uncharacterized protein n=2 Tax=Solanum tuberosum TaxID=4113 RepID=A0ABQ7UJ65_SOLTU|nr:hypothetical protein KY289_027970 [Solanum tuberosum]KAH0749539.1 hypothetical protein KY290_028771 [Solanum tuberosum]
MVQKDDNGEINEAEASTRANSLQESAKEQENKTDDINGTDTFVDNTNKIQSSESLTSIIKSMPGLNLVVDLNSKFVLNQDKFNNNLAADFNTGKVSHRDKSNNKLVTALNAEQVSNHDKVGKIIKETTPQIEAGSSNEQIKIQEKRGRNRTC